MNQKWRYAILLVLTMLALRYGWVHKELFLYLKEVSTVSLVMLTIWILVFMVIEGRKIQYLMRVFGISLRMREWFGLSVCNAMFNYYLPARGGLAAGGYYLKRRYQFAYSRYASLIVASHGSAFILSAAMGLSMTLLCLPVYGVLPGEFLAIFSMLLLFTVAGVLVLVLILRRGMKLPNQRLDSMLRLFREGLDCFRCNPQVLLGVSVLHIAGVLVVGLRLYICVRAVGYSVSILHMMIVASLSTFSLMLPLTPSGLGIREGVITFSAHLLGIPADQAMLAALLDRAIAIAVTVLLGLPLSRILLRDIFPPHGSPSRSRLWR